MLLFTQMAVELFVCCWHISLILYLFIYLFLYWSIFVLIYIQTAYDICDMIKILLKAVISDIVQRETETIQLLLELFIHSVMCVCFLWCMHFKSHGWVKWYSKELLCFAVVKPWFLVMIIHLCVMLYVLLSKCEVLCWKKNKK